MTPHAARVEALDAQSRAATKEPKMDNHDVILENIRAALERDPRIAHAAEIAVGEREGIVTLRGTVSSPHQRRSAVDIAKSVPGVRRVDDGLPIDPRDRSRDDEIRGAALQALLSDDGVPDRVDVSVGNGWLTLRGEVKHQRDSDAAFDAVSGIAGVGGITNRITVVSPGAGR
jgi:osmotically-inducible protein OsmY